MTTPLLPLLMSLLGLKKRDGSRKGLRPGGRAGRRKGNVLAGGRAALWGGPRGHPKAPPKPQVST